MSDRARTPSEQTSSDLALREAFYDWELRGRGWQVWPYAVDIEPAFRPALPPAGRALGVPHEWLEPWADAAQNHAGRFHFPVTVDTSRRGFADTLLDALRAGNGSVAPIAFELLLAEGVLRAQFTLSRDGMSPPPVGFAAAPGRDLLTLLPANQEMALAEIALRREFVVPLGPASQALPALLATSLGPSELAVLQLLVKPVSPAWTNEMLAAVLGPDRQGLFSGADDLLVPCRRKIAAPLFAVALRFAATAGDHIRAKEIVRSLTGCFTRDEPGDGNGLTSLEPCVLDRAALQARLSRRSGMILNAQDLFVMLATGEVPGDPARERFHLGFNRRNGARIDISPFERLRHMEVIGGDEVTGVLANLALHDLEQRRGVGIVDLRGDLYDAVAARLPPARLANVSLVDPLRSPIPLDPLRAETRSGQDALIADLAAIFRQLGGGWNTDIRELFCAALRVLFESGEGCTVARLHAFFAREPLRARLLSGGGPAARLWQERFGALGADALAPLVRRLDRLLDGAGMRAMLVSQGPPLDWQRALRGGVVLARLSPDELGPDRVLMLAGLLTAGLRQALMTAQPEADRAPFFLYVNGIDRVGLPGLEALLALSRTRGVGLILARDPAVTPIEGSAAAWRRHIGNSATLMHGSLRARLRLGEESADIELAPLPVEPADALRRMQDAQLVSDRRHGLTNLVLPQRARSVSRLAITCEDARKRPAFLFDFTRR